MYVAKVVAHGDKVGTLDLLCPALFGGNVLRGLLPLQSSESWALPNPGAEVIVEHFGGGSYRWTPKTLNTPPTWAAANRRGFSDPSDTVSVIADGTSRKILLASASANRKVVHDGAHAEVFEKLKSAIDSISALVLAIPVPSGGTVGSAPALAALVATMQAQVSALASVTVAAYTTDAVVVPPTEVP